MATVSDEIRMLKRLSQGAVAYLFALDARSVRNLRELPRNPDGSYDAKDVVAWSLEEHGPPIVPGSRIPEKGPFPCVVCSECLGLWPCAKHPVEE